MRPLELSLEGFRSYRQATTFDFQDRGLFAIVGPTGAGKSSILDGIIYGLYGRTPQIGRETRKLITSGAGTSRIRLVFEVDGTSWEVTRVLRDVGASAVTLHRQGEGGVEASGERAVNDRITEIVGLDYDAFCSSVTLPQGEFDRFLKATPSERSKILKRIFRYERVDLMRDAAKQRVNTADVELKAIQAELSALPPDPEALLADLQAHLAEREARVAALREGATAFALAQAAVATAQERLRDVGALQQRTTGALADVPPAERLEALAAEEDACLARDAEADASFTAARGAAEEAAANAAEAEAEFGGPSLARARGLVAQRTRVAEQAASRASAVPALERTAGDARTALAAQEAAMAAAEAAVAAAAEVLVRVQHNHAAHVLRADLRPGEPCPVCAQTVATLPPAGPVPEAVGAAQQAAEAAGRQAQAARRRLNDLNGSVSTAAAKLEAARDELASATTELGGLEAELVGLLGATRDPAAEVTRRERLLSAAAREVDAARTVVDAAAQAATLARRSLESSATQRRRVGAVLIRVATILGLDPPGAEDDAGALAGAAKQARDAGAAALAELARRREEVLAQEASGRSEVAGLAERLGLRPDQRIDDALQTASEQVGALGERIEQARQAIEQRQALDARLGEVQERRGRYHRLAIDLTDAKFIAYLLDEDRHRLAGVGSEKLFQLTGRYRFDDEGQFHLLDLANDVVRSPDTLSGGETFLASLALALALAEAVSEGGSRLDCFFLDEGFGSLDAASLDLALDGVESLALPGRLVGIISHVGGVQARLDDLIVLEKAHDGSTIVVQTEGPLAYQPGAI